MDWADYFHYVFQEEFNFLWVVVVLLWWVIGPLFIRRAASLEVDTTKRLLKGYAGFLMVYGVGRLCLLTRNYYLSRSYAITSIEFNVTCRIGYASGLVSIAILSFVILKQKT